MKLFQKNCQRETSEYNIHEEIEKVKAQGHAYSGPHCIFPGGRGGGVCDYGRTFHHAEG